MLKGLKLQGLCQIIGIITSTMDGINTKSVTIPSGYTSGGSISLDTTIDDEVDEQYDLLERIKQALQNKAGGGGANSQRIKKGSISFDTEQSTQTITHNLGCEPFLAILYPKNSEDLPISGSDAAKGKTWKFVYVKNENAEIALCFEGNSSSGAFKWYQTALTPVITATTFTAAAYSNSYKFPANVEFEWLVYGLEENIINENLDEYLNFALTLMNKDITTEVSLTIPDGITYLGQYAISNWQKANTTFGLRTLDLNNVTLIDQGGISGNQNLMYLNAPNVKEIKYDALYNLRSIEFLYFPELITANGGNSFKDCQLLNTLELDKIEKISGSNFVRCYELVNLVIRSNIVCNLTNTIPTTNTHIADGTANIYVPDNLVELYKAATNWSTYADMIKPISQYGGYQS